MRSYSGDSLIRPEILKGQNKLACYVPQDGLRSHIQHSSFINNGTQLWTKLGRIRVAIHFDAKMIFWGMAAMPVSLWFGDSMPGHCLG